MRKSDIDKDTLKKGHFHFNGKGLYDLAVEIKRVPSLRQAQMRTGLGYPGLLTYIADIETNKPQNQVLARYFTFLIDGLGFTPAELSTLRLVDIFPIVFEDAESGAMTAIAGDLSELRQQLITEFLAKTETSKQDE